MLEAIGDDGVAGSVDGEHGPWLESDPPEDYSRDPCTWCWYKDPDAIPERHYSRYGAVRPGRASAQ